MSSTLETFLDELETIVPLFVSSDELSDESVKIPTASETAETDRDVITELLADTSETSEEVHSLGVNHRNGVSVATRHFAKEVRVGETLEAVGDVDEIADALVVVLAESFVTRLEDDLAILK